MVLSDPHEIRLPPVKVSDDMPPSAHAAMRSLADLVAKCTAFQPDQRPTFTHILRVSRRLVLLAQTLALPLMNVTVNKCSDEQKGVPGSGEATYP